MHLRFEARRLWIDQEPRRVGELDRNAYVPSLPNARHPVPRSTQRRWWAELTHNEYLNWVFNGAPSAPPAHRRPYGMGTSLKLSSGLNPKKSHSTISYESHESTYNGNPLAGLITTSNGNPLVGRCTRAQGVGRDCARGRQTLVGKGVRFISSNNEPYSIP